MDRLAVIATEAQRFAAALTDVDPDRPCPTCPDWSASDLLWHLVNVHFFWAYILERRIEDEAELADVEAAKPPQPATVAEMLALRERATSMLVRQLASRADDEPCWSWWPPDQTVGFTRRMQTYEATMHRVDAELTAGLPVSPLAPDVAAGAVDHAVDVMWGWTPPGADVDDVAIVDFHASDTGQRWLVQCGTWSASAERGPIALRATSGQAAASVTGSVNDLALWAWTRGGSVRQAGGEAALAALNAVVHQGMP